MALAMVATANNVFDVGAFDAKTYFSELLRKVQKGAVINISKNGKQVAVLQGKSSIQNKDAYEAHKRIMARSAKMIEFRQQNGFAAITSTEFSNELKKLRNAGRKY